VIEVPETRYTKSGDVNIAYQVAGDGPFDLVHVPPFVSNLELQWEDPAERRYFERLASFCRLIMFDKRGTGLSDRVAVATLEERMDDLRAVMDDVGSQRAAVFGSSEGGAMSILFAATYPQRVSALVLYGAYARIAWAPDYPDGVPEEVSVDGLRHLEENWGRGLDGGMPTLAGPSEVLASSTVKDLVAGSGIRFTDRGSHVLKGVPDQWRVFAVAE
jgi:pimeloyl-ACP methyl ester carboxylesterase